MTPKDKPKRAAGKPFAGDKKNKTSGEAAEKKASAARSAKPKPAVDAAPESGPDKPERISKILARAGVASRRDVERMISEGRVRLNGTLLETPVVNATLADRIEVDGVPIRGIERTRLWLYHKPAGLVTTNADPEGRPTVFDNLPEGLPRVMSVGRLDINTEGLLLLTNDGGLSRVLELPATGWLRRYRVRAHGDVDQAALDKLKEGIAVDGVLYGGIDATLDRTQGHNVWITMGLREGKNREIKNVLGALGLEVNRLIRISYGPFQLGDLPEGDVIEVRGRTLRDQLGPRLIEEAKANFDAPLYDSPAAATADEEENNWKAEEKPRKALREKPGDKRERLLGRLDTRKDERFGKTERSRGNDGEERPKRKPMGHGRTANVWMAPGARPVAEKSEKPAEGGEKRTPRARPEGAPQSKRYGRTKDGQPTRTKTKHDPDREKRPVGRPDTGPRVVVQRAEEDSDWIRADAPASKPRGEEGGFERKRSFGDRQRGEGRPSRDGGDRPARGDRSFGDRPAKPRGERSDRGDRPFGDRPRGEGRPARSEGGDRPRGRSFSGEGRDERPARGDRPFGDRPSKPRGDRADRPRGEGSERPRSRPFAAEGREDRPARGDRPFKPRGERSFGDRPARDGAEGDRPRGGKPAGKSFGGKPGGAKSFSGKPRGDRPDGGGPKGGKPGGSRGGVKRGADRRR
ncbi:pseudouridine synthase [Rhizobium sp. LjRoot30]|uniref:pseudouridine synthase n=1 Tax=Rhizobium sp. LjRoot30 TaxID=3342320 RepID=UPI003ED04A94